MTEHDVRTLACPGPVLKLRDLFADGEREVRFWVADGLCLSNVTRFATSRDAEVTSEPHGDGTFHVTIRAGETADLDREHLDDPALLTAPATGPGRPQVVQVVGTAMGTGDDELGGLLLRSFLKTQLQLERRPDAVLFYNAGVRLCCEGSVLLDDLRALEATGVEVIACGTCLNYFDLADRLAVGRVTDMLEIATRLAEAGSVVRP